MAKKKRGEKLGDIVGKRHPFVAILLIFFGVATALAMLDYTTGQNIFFKEYFEPFLTSTQSAGDNVFFGKVGATFCTASYLAIGFATVMIPVYLTWIGIMCFQRRAKAVSNGTIFATIAGLLLFSILLSITQTAVNAPQQSETFQAGWGGKFGSAVFENLMFPYLNTIGSALTISPIYFFCLVVVFVDNPIDAAGELVNILKKSPAWIWSATKVLYRIIAWLPKTLWNIISTKREDDIEEPVALPRRAKKTKRQQVVEESDDELISEASVDYVEKFDSDSTPDEEPKSIDLTSVEVKVPFSEKPIEDFSNRFDDDDDVPSTTNITTIEVEKRVEEKLDNSPVSPKKKDNYIFPKLSLLAEPTKSEDIPEEDYNSRITEIVNVIGSFGVKVLPDKAYPGPVITRYEVKPATGVKISRIANLEDDITAGIMAQTVRIIAPVPGRGTVGIEVPNVHRLNVTMREVLQSKQWRENKFEIPIALGKDATGVPIVANLKKMTHALIAGSTNSGKSVCINTIIVSMLYKMTPKDLRLIMIDPKMVELQPYNSIPHMLIPVVSDVKKAAAALKWLTNEMMRRYKIFNLTGVKNIDGFNAKILKDKEQMSKAEEEFADMSPEERQAAIAANGETSRDDSNFEIPEEKLPYIVCIIDELADLMNVVGKEVESYIARITQLARAAGIHMIIATQRPDVKVVTGLIKNNLPTRIAFKVTSQIDSRTILDRKGAESLIGWGDMLFLNNGTSDPVRAQGAFLSEDEIESIVEALKVNGEPEYAEEVQAQIDASDEDEDGDVDGGGRFRDAMTAKAVGVIKASGKATTSLLQRKLSIGYGRAAKIIDELEDLGMISSDKGQGQRDIFID